MDPDETLAALRIAATKWAEQDEPDAQRLRDLLAAEMHDAFKALDEWISKGGFLPADWSKLDQ